MIIFLFIFLILFFFNVQANIIWPAMIYAGVKWQWFAILLGFIIEFFIVKKATKYNYKDCFILTFLMNLVSSSLGIILIVISDLFLRLIFGLIPGLHWLGRIDYSSFQGILSWLVFVIFASLISTAIEYLVFWLLYKFYFKKKSGRINLDSFLYWLMFANFLSAISTLLIGILKTFWKFNV